MDIVALLLVVGVGFLAVYYIYQPFLTMAETARLPGPDHENGTGSQAQKVSALVAERNRLIEYLEELDTDFSLGKIQSSDYQKQRAVLMQKGATILRILDEVSSSVSSFDESPARGNDQKQGISPVSPITASQKTAQQEKSLRVCPHCGKPVQKSDHFCSGCGAALKWN